MVEFANDPDSCIIILPAVYTEYHWTARAAHALVQFYLKNWQWVRTMIVAIAGVLVGLRALK